MLSSIACLWQQQDGLEMGDLEIGFSGENSWVHVTLCHCIFTAVILYSGQFFQKVLKRK